MSYNIFGFIFTFMFNFLDTLIIRSASATTERELYVFTSIT